MQEKKRKRAIIALIMGFGLFAVACSHDVSTGSDDDSPGGAETGGNVTAPETPVVTAPETPTEPPVVPPSETPTESPVVTPAVTGTVIYHGNGASTGTVPDAQSAFDGGSVTVAANAGNLSKTGYAFDGWNSKADGTGTAYVAGVSTIAPTGDTVIYARWLSTSTIVSFATLHWPAEITLSATAKALTVYARIFNDPFPDDYRIELIVGTGTDPAAWIPVTATYNTKVGNDKEYVATSDDSVYSSLVAGIYGYAFRIRVTDSVWFYFGTDAVVSANLSSVAKGTLTVVK